MIENSLRSILIGYKPLSAKVGARVYPVDFPQKCTKPAIMYQKIGDPNEGSHKDLLIQYAVHATKYAEAEGIISLVWKAFETFDSGVKEGYMIHTIEQTGQIMQSVDSEASLYERSEIFRVLYSEV